VSCLQRSICNRRVSILFSRSVAYFGKKKDCLVMALSSVTHVNCCSSLITGLNGCIVPCCCYMIDRALSIVSLWIRQIRSDQTIGVGYNSRAIISILPILKVSHVLRFTHKHCRYIGHTEIIQAEVHVSVYKFLSCSLFNDATQSKEHCTK
jgi:hypothetical protein